jgi:hypothetical protein
LGEIGDMPQAEYIEWQEFYGLEPFGLAVTDAMHAHQISMLANVNRNAEKRPEPFTTADFLMFPSDPQPGAEEAEEPTVDGLTADQWKIRMFFESLKRKHEHAASIEQGDSNNTPA